MKMNICSKSLNCGLQLQQLTKFYRGGSGLNPCLQLVRGLATEKPGEQEDKPHRLKDSEPFKVGLLDYIR